MKLPMMHKPCNNCPFTKTCTEIWLGEKRIKSILESESFTCHKTTDCNGGRKQCAGFMLIKDGNSEFEKLANSMNIPIELTGRELVFDNVIDCINHHSVKPSK